MKKTLMAYWHLFKFNQTYTTSDKGEVYFYHYLWLCIGPGRRHRSAASRYCCRQKKSTVLQLTSNKKLSIQLQRWKLHS